MTVTAASVETTAGALGPRQPNGSLPNVSFLKLAAGSQMIDKGVDVGLPFTGSAPDLGAFEYGAATQAIEHPQTAFNKNIVVRTGPELKLFGLARRGNPGVDNRQAALFSMTGQRIFSNGLAKTGIYIEKH
jgi:hypothetical protein